MPTSVPATKLVTFSYPLQPSGGAQTASYTYSVPTALYKKFQRKISALKKVPYAHQHSANHDIMTELQKDARVKLASPEPAIIPAIAIKTNQTGTVEASFVNDKGEIVRKAILSPKAIPETPALYVLPYYEEFLDGHGKRIKNAEGVSAILREKNDSNKITRVFDENNCSMDVNEYFRNLTRHYFEPVRQQLTII